jgi:hypothetical protein
MIKRKGYTVLEITIVATLGIFLLIILARWVGELGNIAIQQSTTQNEINAKFSIDYINDDILALSRCDLGSSYIKEITSGSLSFDIFTNNKYYNIKWVIEENEGSLYRFEQEYSDDCSLLGAPKKKFITSNITSGSADLPFFTPNFKNIIPQDDEIYGLCDNLILERCNINSISINLIIDEYSQQYSYNKTFIIYNS